MTTFLIACGPKPATEAAMDLALKEEFTPRDEALVWLYDSEGNLSTHWIRSDVAGIEVMASRNDLVIPTPGALWRFEVDETRDDHDWIELFDIVSGERISILLDPSLTESVPDEDDVSRQLSPDAGVPDDTGATDEEILETESDSECNDYGIQDAPLPLATMGPFLFLGFEEKRYNCDDELLMVHDRLLTFDVENREEADILSEKELTNLLASDELAELQRTEDAVLDGIAPFFSPAFDLSLTYTFSTHTTFVSNDGEPQSLVETLELRASTAPKRLEPYINAPEIVRSFSIMVPSALPGGWWKPEGTEEQLRKQLSAFVPPSIGQMKSDEEAR